MATQKSLKGALSGNFREWELELDASRVCRQYSAGSQNQWVARVSVAKSRSITKGGVCNLTAEALHGCAQVARWVLTKTRGSNSGAFQSSLEVDTPAEHTTRYVSPVVPTMDTTQIKLFADLRYAASRHA